VTLYADLVIIAWQKNRTLFIVHQRVYDCALSLTLVKIHMPCPRQCTMYCAWEYALCTIRLYAAKSQSVNRQAAGLAKIYDFVTLT